MQVAARDEVFLFDLLSPLAPDTKHALDSCLLQLLSSRQVMKLGFDLTEDLRKLARSRPDLQAFRITENILDLKHTWPIWLQQRPEPVSN